jgi:hypothetical protein
MNHKSSAAVSAVSVPNLWVVEQHSVVTHGSWQLAVVSAPGLTHGMAEALAELDRRTEDPFDRRKINALPRSRPLAEYVGLRTSR